MYIHTIILKVRPENVNKVLEYLCRSEVIAYFSSQTGIHNAFLLESQEEAGKLIAMTICDHHADVQELIANPQFAVLLFGLRPLLITPPEQIGYSILGSISALKREVQNAIPDL